MILTISVCAGTAAQQAPPAGRGQAPAGGGRLSVTVENDLKYASDLRLNLYSVNRPAARPLVVWFHEGENMTTPFGNLVGNGYAVASVGYRPGQLADAQAALDWLRTNAAKYNLDASQIGLVGGGKDGQIATMLGKAGGVQAVVAIYPAVDKMAQATSAGPLPAFMVMHGTADTVVSSRQSEKLINELKAAGANASLKYVPVQPQIRSHEAFVLVCHQQSSSANPSLAGYRSKQPPGSFNPPVSPWRRCPTDDSRNRA